MTHVGESAKIPAAEPAKSVTTAAPAKAKPVAKFNGVAEIASVRKWHSALPEGVQRALRFDDD